MDGKSSIDKVRRSRFQPYFFILPAVVTVLLVEVYPLLYTLYLSFTSLGMRSLQAQFIGLANYGRLLGDREFWASMQLSVIFVVCAISLEFLLGILLALSLNTRLKGRVFFESILLIPIATAPIAVGILFAPLGFFDDFNIALSRLGLPLIDLLEPKTMMTVMILADAWEWTPFIMLVMLSALQSIPRDVLESAEVFGASDFQKLRLIVLPMLLRSPVTAFLLMIRIIDAFKMFEISFSLSSWVGLRGLQFAIDTVTMYMYKLTFNPVYGWPMGYVASISIILLLVSITVAAIAFKAARRVWWIE